MRRQFIKLFDVAVLRVLRSHCQDFVVFFALVDHCHQSDSTSLNQCQWSNRFLAENEDVKRALMTTLFQLGGESSIPELITVANDSMLDESFRAYAIDALGRLRATKARSYLEEAAEEMSPVVRRAAIIALGLMESESSLDLIGERIGDNDQQVRIEAIRAVKAMAKRRSVSYLINEIETEDPETLDEIIEALRVITGKKMGYDTEKSLEENGPVVKKWMAWWEENKGGY